MTRAAQRRHTAGEIAALAEGWRQRRWLDGEAAKVEAIVAEWRRELAAAAVPVPPLHDPANLTTGDVPLAEAQLMLADGYHVEQVCRRTGWGGWWFAGRAGRDGYVRQAS